MAKLKDGFYKLTASSIGSDLLVLLAGGGAKPISDFASSFNVKLWGLDFDGSSDVKGNLTLGYNKLYIGNGTDSFYIGWGAGNLYQYNNYYGHYFSTKSGEVMRINSSGNVGIGTTNPGYRLDVAGPARFLSTTYFGYSGACDLYLQRQNGYSYITASDKLMLCVGGSSGNYALGIDNNSDVYFYGSINIPANRYASLETYGINLNNSDIIGANSIYTQDPALDSGEGLNFARSNGNWDSLTSYEGILYYYPNRPGTTLDYSGAFEVLHKGNYKNYIDNMYWANVPVSATSSTDTNPTFNNVITKGLLTVSTGGSNLGIKVGDTYINSISGDLIFQNNRSIRFGGGSWDYNIWAGLKYNHSTKTISLGLADGIEFVTNAGLHGGTVLFPGIARITAPLFYYDLKSASTTPIIYIGANNVDATLLRVYSSDTADPANYAGRYGFSVKYLGTGSDDTNAFVLYADNKSSTTQNIAIGVDLRGYVGICTTSPKYKLDVNGALRANGNILLEAANNTTGGGIAFWDGSGYVNGTINASTLILNYAGGNVGIGTLNPIQKLHVNGDIFLNNQLYFTNSNVARIKYGSHTSTALGSYPLPSLGSNGIGIFVRPSTSTDEGGLIITEDTCMVFNSADAGWSFQVHNTDLNQKDFSGTSGDGTKTRVFGIVDSENYAWSKGGYKKEGSSNSYVLLGGGSHKSVTDFAMASDFVKKSGDTMSGNLTVSNGTDYTIIAPGYMQIRKYSPVNPTANQGSIEFSYYGGQCVYLGYTPNDSYRISKGLKIFGDSNDNGNCWLEVEGNIYSPGFVKNGSNDNYVLLGGGGHKLESSLSVNYAASTGNADTVDGYHASGLVKFYLSPMDSGATANSAKTWFTGTMPSSSGAIVYNVPGAEKTIIAGKSSGAFGHMLQLNYDDTYLRILRYYSGTWKSTDWEKISAGYADSAGYASSAGSATNASYYTLGPSSTFTNVWDCNKPDRIVYSDYGSSGRSVTNAPSGWNYGTLLELGHMNYRGQNSSLNMQLMWDVAHNTTNGGTLWFRGNCSTYGWAKNWCKVLSDQNYSSYALPLSGGWMNKDANIYFKNPSGGTSPYAGIGYRTSVNGTMHCTSSANASGAFYIFSNGYDSANDYGGIAIDNEGVTVFGAGDPGNNFTGIFRVLNEDNPADGPLFIVTKASGATVKYNMYAAHFYESSDQQLKTNIQEILNSDKMPIIKEFDWKEDNSHSYGLIAQELEEQGYSELVSTKDDGYKTVNYSAALSLIVGKLQVKIKELEKEIEILKNKN